MDITTLFKSRLEIVRNRNKALGTMGPDLATSSQHQPHAPSKGKSKLFPGRKSEYYAKARELASTITSLQEYLVDIRSPYLSLGTSTFGSAVSVTHVPAGRDPELPLTMTDAEKEQVDHSVQKIIQNVQKRTFEFQRLIETNGVEKAQPQLYIHLVNVINSLRDYLKTVCGNYAEIRAIRVKRTLDLQAMSRITGHSRLRSRLEARPASTSTVFDDLDSDPGDPMAAAFPQDEDYSPEELQIFEEENSALLRSLNTVADEVDQIESSIVQIAELQEIFTEKVLLQDREISQIENLVVGTTENVKGGNEQLRQAIQQNADFRAWVLFFIIVMSLSLLFLDWYND